MKKRILAMLLSVVMLIGVLPAAAFATDTAAWTEVATAEELKDALDAAGAASSGNSYIKLTSDIALEDAWTPVGVDGYHGAGYVTLDGAGYTISGLTAPLFAGGFAGKSGIIIKNLTIADSAIVSTNDLGSGAFIETVDSMETITLDNCHLVNSTVTGSRTGGLIGWTSGYNNVDDGPVKTYVTVLNCSVTGSTITGNGTVGGIIGHAGANDWTYTTIEGCTVENTNLTSYDDSYRVGAIVGTANVGQVSISDCESIDNTIAQINGEDEITRPEGQSDLYGRAPVGTTGNLVVDGELVAGTAVAKNLETSVYYATLEEAIDEASAGDTIVLFDGTHTMPSKVVDKNITIAGGENAVVEMLNAVNASGSTINFDGVTVMFDNGNYEGLQHAAEVTYTNCTHIGTQFLYAPVVEFSGCTFEMYDAATEYAVWTYGASDVTFADCEFDTNGKAILVYTEGAHTAEITVDNCDFYSNGTFTGKAAVEVGQSAYGEADYTLYFTDSTADDNFVANNSSSNLWGNKNSMTGEGLVVVIDDVQVYPVIYVDITVPVDYFVYSDGPFVGESFEVDVTIHLENSAEENRALIYDAVADLVEANLPAGYSVRQILVRNSANGWFVRVYVDMVPTTITVPVDYYVYPEGPFVGESFEFDVTIYNALSDEENIAIIEDAVADLVEANLPADYSVRQVLVRNGSKGWFVRVYVDMIPTVITVPVDYYVYPEGPFVGSEFEIEVTIYNALSDDENAALIEEALGTLGVDNIPAPYTHNYTLIRNRASGWFVRVYLNKADANIDIIVDDEIYDGAPVDEAAVVITDENGDAVEGYYTIQYHMVDEYGFAIGDAIYSRNTQWPEIITGELPTDAGLYRVGVTFHGNDEYNRIDWYSEIFEIEKDSVLVEIEDVSKIYDGQPVDMPAVTITGATSGEAVDTYYTILIQQNDETLYSFNTRYPDVIGGTLKALPTDAGTYTVVVVTEATDNYTKASWVTKQITIAQKDIADAEIALGDALIYNGTEQTQTIVSVTVDGLDVTYTVSGNTGTDAGTYTLTVTGNGNFTGTATKTWTIEKALVAKPAADTTVFVYNKTEQTYTVAESELYTVSGNKRTNAGSQDVIVSLNDKDNYAWEDGTTDDVIFTFTIAKATPVLTIESNKDKLYGGGKVKLTVTGAPDEGTYFITSKPSITPSIDGSYLLPNSQRTYTFTVTYAESENYNEASASCTVVVVKYYHIPKLYKLTFEENGGTMVKDVTKGYGVLVDLAKYETTRDGYEFTGWYLDPALTKEATFITLRKNTTVYAGWKSASPFTDVYTSDWFYGDVMYVYENGLMIGTDLNQGLFEPNLTLDRATIVTTLWRLAGSPAINATADFEDLENDWYTDAMNWAIASDIIRGYGDGTCKPLAPVTREEVAAIFNRFAKYMDVDTKTEIYLVPQYTYSDWAENDVIWGDGIGLFDGIGTDVSDLTDEANRAEIAAYLRRLCELIEK